MDSLEEVLKQQHVEMLHLVEGWFQRLERMLQAKTPSPSFPTQMPFELTQISEGTMSSPIVSLTAQLRLPVYEESIKRLQTQSENKRPHSRICQWYKTEIKARCRYIAEALPFNVFFAFVILSNSMFLGIQMEMKAEAWKQNAAPPSFIAPNLVYAILFTGEMLIRVSAWGPIKYFYDKGCAWNWLDVLVVIPAWIEMAIDLSTDEQGLEGGAASNFRIIRIFKVTRLLQVVRSLRIVKFISALRALVMSVVDTTRQLLWALILLGLVQYSFGILFTDAVLDYSASNGPHEDQMEFFGSVYLSVITLFRSILGGIDWAWAADSLEPVGWIWVQVFHLYIAFCGFADAKPHHSESPARTERDHETLIQNKNRFKDLVSKIWSKMDVDGHGQITITEFERMFEDESMKAFFSAIEINAVDAWTLFDSLDVDGDHTISVDESAAAPGGACDRALPSAASLAPPPAQRGADAADVARARPLFMLTAGLTGN
eukprot:g7231.t1